MESSRKPQKGDTVIYIEDLSINQAIVTDIIEKEGFYRELISKFKLSNGKELSINFEFFDDLDTAKKSLKDKIDSKLKELITERDKITDKIKELTNMTNGFEV